MVQCNIELETSITVLGACISYPSKSIPCGHPNEPLPPTTANSITSSLARAISVAGYRENKPKELPLNLPLGSSIAIKVRNRPALVMLGRAIGSAAGFLPLRISWKKKWSRSSSPIEEEA
ncbi:hypothetical protein F3Y22_tig00110893pilonHSYRG00253 [Hibiscus syriacus]|uniref:Uncharacterized protein n=1 Tax=Hibiscus syriacus TaxID=106335 RepID=A0A6A2ZGI1_HIBSY|nr:hypothetical protein F3Y22_tig00110893pilonHSYRG00253 [Hibiscus syriacus]